MVYLSIGHSSTLFLALEIRLLHNSRTGIRYTWVLEIRLLFFYHWKFVYLSNWTTEGARHWRNVVLKLRNGNGTKLLFSKWNKRIKKSKERKRNDPSFCVPFHYKLSWNYNEKKLYRGLQPTQAWVGVVCNNNRPWNWILIMKTNRSE